MNVDIAELRNRWNAFVEDGDAIRAADFANSAIPELLSEIERLNADRTLLQLEAGCLRARAEKAESELRSRNSS